MKKQIISILSVFLMVAILFGIVPFSVSANTTETRDITENLTVHYDFEGTTASEYYADKATAGKSKDTLTLYNGGDAANGDIVVSNGVATSVAGTSTLACPNANDKYSCVYLSTASTADVKATSGEGTFFMRFKLDELATPWRNTVISAVHTTNTETNVGGYMTGPIQMEFDREGGTNAWRVNSTTSAGRNATSFKGELSKAMPAYNGYVNTKFDSNAWWNVFVVLENNGSGSIVRKVYVGNDNGVTLDLTTAISASSLLTNDTTRLSLFGFTVQQRRAGLSIDDFRYYNTALTVEEMASVTNSLGGGRDIRENLTVHYDFEGTTADKYYADKATAGDSEDTLTLYNGGDATNGDIVVSNGVATSVAGTSTLACPNANDKYSCVYLSTASTADVKATSGEGTFFMRFKLDELATPWRNTVISAVHTTNTETNVGGYMTGPIQMEFDREGGTNAWRVNSTVSTGRKITSIKGELANSMPPYSGFSNENYDSSAWYNLFVILSTTADGNLTRRVYVSTGSGVVAEITSAALALGASSCTTDGTTRLSLFGFTVQQRRAGLSIDDFRYYNAALTLNEMNSVFDDGKFADIATSVENIVGQKSTTTYTSKYGHKAYDVRFIAEIDATAVENQEFTKAGFNVTVNGKTKSYDTMVCFDSLLAENKNGGIDQIDAKAGKKFIAIVLTDIPVDSNIELEIEAYVVTATKTISTRKVTFTLAD